MASLAKLFSLEGKTAVVTGDEIKMSALSKDADEFARWNERYWCGHGFGSGGSRCRHHPHTGGKPM